MKGPQINIELKDRFNQNYIDALLIWIISLFSLRLYTFLISVTIAKAISLAGILVVITFLIIQFIYGSVPLVKKRFRIEILLIFISLIISVFGAYIFHEQNAGTTLFAQYEYYIFFFYFLIHRLKPDPDKLLDMCVWLGYGYTIIYFAQYIVYPMEITSSKAIYNRGTVRILMPGSEFMVTAWFIQLTRYFITKKVKYLFGLIPLVVIIILLATRQVMASIALLTLLAVGLSRTLKSKASLMILIALAIIPFYYVFQGVFEQIIGVTTEQKANIQDDIRVLAARYFLFDLNDNPCWMLIGNGYPANNSAYGRFVFRISEELGYNQSDVGIIGTFSRYGVFFVLGEVAIFIRLVFWKLREKFTFIRYNALVLLMTMFTGAGLKASSIVLIIIMVYIAEVDKHYPLLKTKNQ